MGEPSLIHQAYRFALDPTDEQQALLISFTGASRFWFNQGLRLVKERLDARHAGQDVRVPWSYHQLCSEFKGDAIKDELAPWRHEVVTGSYQAGLEMLGRALQNFSEGRKTGRHVGFPRFRAKGACRESVIFQRPRIKSSRSIEFARRLGPVRTKERMSKLLRLLERDERARVMRATVSRSGAWWYVSFTVERSHKQRRARRPEAAVGVDVGLTGWGMVVAQVKYKASWSDGTLLVAADRFFPSSKTCSACGAVKAKLLLSERVFTCAACGLALDRDLNAALNLARLAQHHAQAEGKSKCHVACIGWETRNARGGQVRPITCDRPRPLKREASSEASQVREDLALAA
jgi:transposase